MFKNLGIIGLVKMQVSVAVNLICIECIESNLLSKKSKSNYLYALSPFVPLREDINNLYFQPFTRFGKHGESLAKSKKPFKKPIIMADEGALINTKKTFDKNYPILGSAVCGISDVEPNAVTQGYTLCLPVNLQEGSYGK
jgi:CRISPR-associated protein Csm4